MKRTFRELEDSNDEDLYHFSVEELRAGHFSKSLWSKALTKSSFDEDKARRLYVELRVEQLRASSDLDRELADVKKETEIVDQDIKSLERKLSEAKVNAAFSNPLFIGQFVLISAIAGLYQKSWIVFFVCFFGFPILMNIPYVNRILGVAFAGFFGLLGYVITAQWYSEGAGYVVGGVVFLLALGVNNDSITILKKDI